MEAPRGGGGLRGRQPRGLVCRPGWYFRVQTAAVMTTLECSNIEVGILLRLRSRCRGPLLGALCGDRGPRAGGEVPEGSLSSPGERKEGVSELLCCPKEPFSFVLLK